MSEDRKEKIIPHNVIMTGRKKIQLSGIKDVGSFDENRIECFLPDGALVIRGNGLHVESISLDSGDVEIDGKITSLIYTDDRKKSGVISKLFG